MFEWRIVLVLLLLVDLQEEEGQQSLECVQANQFFPKKSPVLEEENMQVSRNICTAVSKLSIWGVCVLHTDSK